MKRKDAFRKLRVICQRLDEIDPKRFFVIPLRLYLFGSVLTDKPNPSDIDLLFEYQENPIDPDELVYRMSYGCISGIVSTDVRIYTTKGRAA